MNFCDTSIKQIMQHSIPSSVLATVNSELYQQLQGFVSNNAGDMFNKVKNQITVDVDQQSADLAEQLNISQAFAKQVVLSLEQHCRNALSEMTPSE